MSEKPGFHKANKNALGSKLVQTLLIKPALRHAFGGVYVCVDPLALKLRSDRSRPVIVCMTHSGWYDGYIAFALNERLFHRDSYLMMEEQNLARYFFFTWAGVFGIDRDNVRNALASIDYISGVLKADDNKALFMFPQGTMRHPDLRPLKLYSGVSTIARRVGRCALVPVAIRYDFIMEQAPDAFLRIGPPIMIDDNGGEPLNAKELTNNLTNALTSLADRLHADVSAYNRAPYRRITSGRGSINNTWDAASKRLAHLKNRFSRRTR